MMRKILYIGNTPLLSNELDIELELEIIKKQCQEYRNLVELGTLLNPSLPELLTKLREWDPHLLHFGGHGSPDQGLSIITTSVGTIREITKEDFDQILQHFNPSLEVLVLNSCYGEPIAEDLVNKSEVHCVIAFRQAVHESTVSDYIETFYKELLSGTLVKDAVQYSNLTVENKSKLFWNSSIAEPQFFRFIDPAADRLREGNTVEGKKLVEKLLTDDLGSIWLVSDLDESTTRIFYRRFLRLPGNSFDRQRLFSTLKEVRASFRDVLGILTPVGFDFECENPYVEYVHEEKVLWKTVSRLLEELALSYPLDINEIHEVNSIILQLARLVDIAHHTGDGFVHGRINVDGIIVVDQENNTSSTFGNLRPIITDYGFSLLTSRKFKNTCLSLSPRIKNGGFPGKTDDVFSVIAIWFWLLTGQKPNEYNVNNTYHWYSELQKRGLPYLVTETIVEVFNAEAKTSRSISSSKLVDVLIEVTPKWKLPQTDKGTKEGLVEIENSFGMKFSLIKSGEYTQGSNPDEFGHQPDEKPRRKIYLDAYYISQCVVTIANLLEIADAVEDYGFKQAVEELRNFQGDKNIPATTIYQDGAERKISWQFAKLLCDILSDVPAEQELGLSYFLPTESQWEVACRAGTVTAFNTGFNELKVDNANFKVSSAGIQGIKPVKSYPPNSWKLYEMHGNVWEFCTDYYHRDYDARDKRNPRGYQPKNQWWRRFVGIRYGKVVRGGDFQSPSLECRSANRAFIEDNAFGTSELHEPDRDRTVGIRLVCYTLNLKR